MSSWQDRVNKTIKLKSPSGVVVDALWKGNKRIKDKKLGLFSYPKARGTLAQDLDVEGDKYPLTIYFEGPNHDIDAQRFWNACNERGTWKVEHPTRGILTLQLVTVTEDIQPVTNGNITEMDSEWIEVGIDNPAASVAQAAEDVLTQLDDTQAAAADQFVEKVKVDKPSLLARLRASLSKASDAIASAQSGDAITRQRDLTEISDTAMGITSLVGMIQDAVATPALNMRDAATRYQYFEKIISGAVGLTPKTATAGGVNSMAVQELVVTACICGMAQATVDAEFATREEALGCLERIQQAFLTVTANLDAAQTIYADSPIDRQYFSQSGSFNDLAELLRMTRALLLRRSFDLAAAKRITLRRDRAPIEIAITEGVDFDTFIASNALKGDEILLLPTGREVVIYL